MAAQLDECKFVPLSLPSSSPAPTPPSTKRKSVNDMTSRKDCFPTLLCFSTKDPKLVDEAFASVFCSKDRVNALLMVLLMIRLVMMMMFLVCFLASYTLVQEIVY